jgi:hypothetical protein
MATAGVVYPATLHSSADAKNWSDAWTPAEAASPKNALMPVAHDVHFALSFMLPERSNMNTR